MDMRWTCPIHEGNVTGDNDGDDTGYSDGGIHGVVSDSSVMSLSTSEMQLLVYQLEKIKS